MNILDSAEPSEQFPYPVNITREDFADVAHFDPDGFLYKHHRYTSLDSLLADLRSLSKSLNQDLLDLVNNEYTDFIQLGQSIGSCVELIDNLSVEVRKFKASVGSTVADFSASAATSAAVLQHKRSLNLLKNKAKLIILLHEQCVSFESLVALNMADRAPDRLEHKLRTLTALHLSLSKIYDLIMESVAGADETKLEGERLGKEKAGTDNVQATAGGSNGRADGEICQFFDNVVKTKVLALKIEFKLYLDELLVMAKADPTTYGSLTLTILHTYRILGMSSEAVKTLRHKQ